MTTADFHYQPRWPDVAATWPPLTEGDAQTYLELLEGRDRQLEDYLASTTSIDPWPDWTVTVTQNTTRAGTTNEATITKLGRTAIVALQWVSTVVGSANNLFVGYPTGATPARATNGVLGHGRIGGGAPVHVSVLASTSGFAFVVSGSGAFYATALAVGDLIDFTVVYETTT